MKKGSPTLKICCHFGVEIWEVSRYMINGGRFHSDRVTEVHLCDLAAEIQHTFFLLLFFSGGEWMVIYFTEGKSTNYSAKMSGGKMNVAHIRFFIITNMILFILLSPFFLLWLNDLSLIFVVTVKLVCQQINDWQSEAESCWLCAFSATRHISLIRGSFDEKP